MHNLSIVSHEIPLTGLKVYGNRCSKHASMDSSDRTWIGRSSYRCTGSENHFQKETLESMQTLSVVNHEILIAGVKVQVQAC